MARFTDDADMQRYYEYHCLNCKNCKEHERCAEECYVWQLHIWHNDNPKWRRTLDALIPRGELGENLACKMFLIVE